jgi:molybdopterin biosynthesis enzyme MoaB
VRRRQWISCVASENISVNCSYKLKKKDKYLLHKNSLTKQVKSRKFDLYLQVGGTGNYKINTVIYVYSLQENTCGT